MDRPLLAPTFQVENEDFDLFLKSNLTMMWKYANDQGNLLKGIGNKNVRRYADLEGCTLCLNRFFSQ